MTIVAARISHAERDLGLMIKSINPANGNIPTNTEDILISVPKNSLSRAEANGNISDMSDCGEKGPNEATLNERPAARAR
ncbi:MAG: hypothetical protein IPJ93_07460 [Bacteroidota bacterium]|nr:MAG: hypothetical protein IPJ93_07460 [Bacteroidota bacterium]